MEELCIKCKGKGLCGKPCKILARFRENAPKPKIHFSGKSAPEIFVGRIGYPYINSGILAPSENDNLANFSTAEQWSKNNFSIENILRLRGQLIYGRGNSHIKSPGKLKQVTQELALSSKPVSTEFFLKQKPKSTFTPSKVFAPMTNPAPIKKVALEENPFVEKKIDYLVSDSDAKATTALNELYKSKISVDHLQKLLSVGTLGRKVTRRMVPTRWSITAVDDTISKQLLEKIRYFPEINEITLFSGNFVGNYIEALLLPGKFSFEATEFWVDELGNPTISKDDEGFFGRKTYASNVTGGYYAMRLPTTELLTKINRQATVLIVREIKQEYYAPLGVGIVREATRRAFKNTPKTFETIEQALADMSSRISIKPDKIKQESKILQNYGKQKSLSEF